MPRGRISVLVPSAEPDVGKRGGKSTSGFKEKDRRAWRISCVCEHFFPSASASPCLPPPPKPGRAVEASLPGSRDAETAGDSPSASSSDVGCHGPAAGCG